MTVTSIFRYNPVMFSRLGTAARFSKSNLSLLNIPARATGVRRCFSSTTISDKEKDCDADGGVKLSSVNQNPENLQSLLNHSNRTESKDLLNVSKNFSVLRSKNTSQDLKEKFPKQWAIFSSIDINGNGLLDELEVYQMCEALGVPEMSEELMDVIDEDISHNSDLENREISFQAFIKHFQTVTMIRKAARKRSWHRCLGLGVAGNVPGHLEMAGEGVTPTVTESDSDEFKPLPSALFAFYVPWSKRKVGKARLAKPTLQHGPKNAGAPQGKEIVQPTLQEILDENTLKQEKNVLEMHNKVREELDRLRRFPVTNSTIEFPRNEGSGNVQVEPELALHCDIVYENVNKSDSSDNSSNSNGPGNGNQISKRKVLKLIPTKIAAFNDCSIRALEGSSKLSEKKNWGFGSKGISTDYFEITCFSPTVPETGLPSLVSRLWISSYILRDGKIYSYTKPAAARSYLLFFDELLEWIVTQINDQGDVDKWEDVSELLAVSNYPSRTWIALGAGEYTDWGNENFLEKHDETAVIVYDEAIFGAEGPDFGVIEKIFLDVGTTPPGCIALHQTFV